MNIRSAGYAGAAEELTGRNSKSRKLHHSTYLQRRDDSIIAVLYHNTDIITLHADGRIVLDSGGWKTYSTKERFNRFGFRIYQEKGVWYLQEGPWNEAKPIPYEDGMTLRADGTWDPETIGTDPQRLVRAKRSANRYAKAYMAALAGGKVDPPGAGDCMFCQFREVKTGRPLGEVGHGCDHIESHIEESYFVPSLLSRAIEVFPVSQAALWYLGSFWDQTATVEQRETARKAGAICADQIEKALRRYTFRQLGGAA